MLKRILKISFVIILSFAMMGCSNDEQERSPSNDNQSTSQNTTSPFGEDFYNISNTRHYHSVW